MGRFRVKVEGKTYIGTAKEIVLALHRDDFMNTEGKADYMWEVTERVWDTMNTHIPYTPNNHFAFLHSLSVLNLIKLERI